MAINRLILGNETLFDLTSDTVDAAHLLSGYTAHDKTGAQIVGTASAGAELKPYGYDGDPYTFYDISINDALNRYMNKESGTWIITGSHVPYAGETITIAVVHRIESTVLGYMCGVVNYAEETPSGEYAITLSEYLFFSYLENGVVTTRIQPNSNEREYYDSEEQPCNSIVVQSASGSGGGGSMQDKSVTITENGSTIVYPDSGYDGLYSVEVIVDVSGGGSSSSGTTFLSGFFAYGPPSVGSSYYLPQDGQPRGTDLSSGSPVAVQLTDAVGNKKYLIIGTVDQVDDWALYVTPTTIYVLQDP